MMRFIYSVFVPVLLLLMGATGAWATTYELVAGTGDTDNASFEIVAGKLKTRAVFDYETKSSYSIRVKATDSGGATLEKQFTVTVNDVNETPPAPTKFPLNVSVTPAGAGSITSNPFGIDCGTDCSEEYLNGASVALTATPSEGYEFVGWSGASVSNDMSTTVTINNAASITAKFREVVPETADLSLIGYIQSKNDKKISFYHTLRNNGPNHATEVTVTTQMPSYLTPESIHSIGTGQTASFDGTMVVGDLPAGESVYFVVTALIAEGAEGETQNYKAVVSGADIPEDPDLSNNTCAIALSEYDPDSVDLVIYDIKLKEENNAGGKKIVFKITVANPETYPEQVATGLKLHATVPPEILSPTFIVSSSEFEFWHDEISPEQANFDGSSVTVDLGYCKPGKLPSLTIYGQQKTIKTDTTITVSATISADQKDNNTSNNTGSLAAILHAEDTEFDLAVMMEATPMNPAVGDIVTIPIVVANYGPDTMKKAVLKIPLNDFLLPAYVSHTTSQGIFTPVTVGDGSSEITNNNTWNIGELAPGETATMTILVKCTNVAPTYVSATFLGSAINDTNLMNNGAVIVLNTDKPDAVLGLTSDLIAKDGADLTSVLAGDRVDFNLELTNTGTSSAEGVQVKVTLPPGMAVSGFTASSGCFDPETSIWYVDNPSACTQEKISMRTSGMGVKNNDTPTLGLELEVMDADAISDAVITASIVGQDENDPDTTNNSASQVLNNTELFNTDIAVQVTPGADTVTPGGTTSYTVLVRNNGPDAAGGIEVGLELDPAFTATGNSVSQGLFDADTGTWAIGSLNPGEVCTLGISVTAGQTAAATETVARVTRVLEKDINPENDTSTARVSVGESYTITIASGANGIVTGDLSQTVAQGSAATAVSAAADNGYVFTGWTGEYTGTDNPLTITNVSSDMTVTAVFEIAATNDTDGDGVADTVEQGPDGTDENYDGNSDGIPDKNQSDVTSIGTAEAGGYVTISTSSGYLNLVAMHTASADDHVPDGYVMTQGVYTVWVKNIPMGGTAEITFQFQSTMKTPENIYVFGPDSESATNHWYEPGFADVDGADITYTCQDGGDGDDTTTPDGMIMLKSAPAWKSTGGDPGTSSSSSSSNCFINAVAGQSAMFFGLLILAGIWAVRRKNI